MTVAALISHPPRGGDSCVCARSGTSIGGLNFGPFDPPAPSPRDIDIAATASKIDVGGPAEGDVGGPVLPDWLELEPEGRWERARGSSTTRRESIQEGGLWEMRPSLRTQLPGLKNR